MPCRAATSPPDPLPPNQAFPTLAPTLLGKWASSLPNHPMFKESCPMPKDVYGVHGASKGTELCHLVEKRKATKFPLKLVMQWCLKKRKRKKKAFCSAKFPTILISLSFEPFNWQCQMQFVFCGRANALK